MKRKFIKKKGFTLVEILVAFVIFGIMAGMVSVLLRQTMTVKQGTLDIEEELEAQAEAYYLTEYEKTYSDANKAGEVKFNFSSGEFGFDYALQCEGDEEDLLQLDHIVGDVNYKSDFNSSSGSDGNGGSVTNRLDSRIMVTKGIDKIQMKVIDKGSGRYVFGLLLSNSVEDGYKYFAQIKMLMPGTINDIGYCDVRGEPNGMAPSTQNFRITELEGNTLRIGSNMPSSLSDAGSKKSMLDEASYLYFWVDLGTAINVDDLNATFGYCSSDATATNTGTSTNYDGTTSKIFSFTPYIEGETIHYNVLGGFPKAAEEEPETDESSETTEAE